MGNKISLYCMETEKTLKQSKELIDLNQSINILQESLNSLENIIKIKKSTHLTDAVNHIQNAINVLKELIISKTSITFNEAIELKESIIALQKALNTHIEAINKL